MKAGQVTAGDWIVIAGRSRHVGSVSPARGDGRVIIRYHLPSMGSLELPWILPADEPVEKGTPE